jgi:phage tail-like protein
MRAILPKPTLVRYGPAIAVSLAVSAAALAFSADGRSYVTGYYLLELDGVKTGFIKSVDGGGISADVVTEPLGAASFAKKHIGQLKYEDFTIQVGFGMSRPVYDWIAASWNMNHQRKNGAIVAADFKLDAKSQREFFNALLTETTIPACDANAKEPAYITLKFAPEYTRASKAAGSIQATPSKNEQKLWLPSNFRLTIDGLDSSKVSKIDAFTIKQTVVRDELGDARDYLKEPGKIEFPNLKITIAEAGAQSWAAWFEDFVIKGNSSEAREKNGTLEFLNSDGTKALARIRFHNLGIFRLGPPKPEADPCTPSGCPASNASRDAVAKVQAELYCERMEFEALNVR